MKTKLVLSISGLLFLVVVFASCNKVVNTTATVTVLDEKEDAVQGAIVHVFPTPSPQDTIALDTLVLIESLDETKVTDNKGQVFFDYTEYYKRGQTGLFVLDMEVKYELPDTIITVQSVLKVEEKIENQKQVILPITL